MRVETRERVHKQLLSYMPGSRQVRLDVRLLRGANAGAKSHADDIADRDACCGADAAARSWADDRRLR